MASRAVRASAGTSARDNRLVPGFLLLPVSDSAMVVAREVGQRRKLKAGEQVQLAGHEPWVGVVGSGVLRALIESATGRQATLAYGRAGAVIGVPDVITGRAVTTVEAMVPSEVFDLPVGELRAKAQVHPELTVAVAEDLAQLVAHMIGEASALAFGDLRTRAARHLLVLAEANPATQGFEVKVTQGALANAVASSPDAVGRVLRQMEAEGLITLAPGRVRLGDIEGLLALTEEL